MIETRQEYEQVSHREVALGIGHNARSEDIDALVEIIEALREISKEFTGIVYALEQARPESVGSFDSQRTISIATRVRQAYREKLAALPRWITE